MSDEGYTPSAEEVLADLRAACWHGLVEARKRADKSKSPEFERMWEMRASTLSDVLGAIGYPDAEQPTPPNTDRAQLAALGARDGD